MAHFKRLKLSTLLPLAALIASFVGADILVSARQAPVQAAEISEGKTCRNKTGMGKKFTKEYFVYFDSASTVIKNKYKVNIERAVDRAKGQHAHQICLFGKASKKGNAASNARLSRQRSKAVAAFMRSEGWKGKIAIEPEGEAWGFFADELSFDSEEDRRVRIRLSM
ncbi:MAG: OmpA family protein [Parvibaculaceae bacterium]|nr:OmpA family protein [Parvibaculaceae bacterium]